MKFPLQYLLGIPLLSMTSCHQGSNTMNYISDAISNARDMKRIDNVFLEIHIDQQKEISPVEFDQLVDSVYYVQLDNQESIGEIHDIIVQDSRIFILDQISKRVFIFGMDGHLVRCIDDRGHASNEYLDPSAIFLDKNKRNLYIKDGQQLKLLCYDYDGEFLYSSKATPAIYANMIDKTVINQMAEGQSYDQNVNYHVITSIEDSIFYKALPYYPIQLNYIMSRRMEFNYCNELLFQPTMSDTVYSIVSDSTYCVKYVFKNEKSIWAKADEKLSFDVVKSLMRSGDYNEISHFYDTENYAFFAILEYNRNAKMTLVYPKVYDKIHGNILDVVNSEKSVDPIRMIDLNIIGTIGNTCISSLNLYYLKEFLKVNPERENYYVDKHLLEMIKSSDVDSNPTLVFFSMKDVEE